jgi:hypothetical protein
MSPTTFTACACALVLCACARAPRSAELRSPSHDYPPPARTTADGEVLGADRKPITDTLGERHPPAKAKER